MPSEVGDTVPASQTVPNVTTWPPREVIMPFPWQGPPKYLCRKCNKTFDFPEYKMYKPSMSIQLARPRCPHCHRKWEQ